MNIHKTGWCGQGPDGDHRAFYRWYGYDKLGNKMTETWNYGAYDINTGTVMLTSTWSVAGELLGLGGGLGGVSYSAGARGAQGNLGEQYGNGVQGTFAYDAMNRQVGRWACLYTSMNISPNSNKDTDYTYDLAGNLLNDGVHTYSYDQQGNLIYVDSGSTTWDNYDALNRRILHVTRNYTSYLRYEYGLETSSIFNCRVLAD